MSDYLDVKQFRQVNGKWRATRLGYAKKNDKGQLNVYLDALPIPDAEGCRLTIERREDRDDRQQSQGYGGGPGGFDDSEIPFGPEWRA